MRNVKRRLAALFTATAMMSAINGAKADFNPLAAPMALLSTAQGQNPADVVISAKDALHYAKTGSKPGGGVYINRIIDMVARAQEIPLGRMLTQKAADGGVLYNVGYPGADSAACYVRPLNVVIFAFKTADFDYSSDESFAKNKDDMQDSLYHELTHFLQKHFWKNMDAPSGVRSFDKGLWGLAIESQAELLAHTAMLQHRYGPFVPHQDTLLINFTGYMNNAAPVHLKDYGLLQSKLDDGTPLRAQDFVKAFGFCPVTGKNFLSNKIKTIDDVYKVFAFPNATLKSVYERETNILKARDGKMVLKPAA